MFLADTNAISELRKGPKGDPGVISLFLRAEPEIFQPVQALGEMRQCIENLKYRGDFPQARKLEEWFQSILKRYRALIIGFDAVCAEKWGALMSPNNQNPVDKQIAAIALVYDLTVITRNTNDFAGTGARLLNPFLGDAAPASPSLVRKSH